MGYRRICRREMIYGESYRFRKDNYVSDIFQAPEPMQRRASLQKKRLRKNDFGDKTGFVDLPLDLNRDGSHQNTLTPPKKEKPPKPHPSPPQHP